jgi:hypothetical protein
MTNFGLIFALTISSGILSVKPVSAQLNHVETNAILALDAVREISSCENLLWPGFDLNEMEWIAVHPESKQAWSWMTGLAEPKLVSYDELPEPAKQLFSYTMINATGDSLAKMVIQVDNEKNRKPNSFLDLFETLVHEAFHEWGQKGWKYSFIQRGVVYPIEGEARYGRKMQIDNLYSAALNPANRDLHLQFASFWQQKLDTHYPNDYNSTIYTDRVEGTANFVQSLAYARFRGGCNVKGEQLIELISKRLQENERDIQQLYKDNESYTIGTLALALAYDGSKQQALEWSTRFKVKDESPLKVLFEALGVKPSSVAPESSEIRKDILMTAATKNKQISEALTPFSSSDYLLLVLPIDIVETYKTSGFVHINNDSEISYLMLDLESFREEELQNGFRINLKGISSTMGSAPCSSGLGSSFIVPIPKSAIRREENGVFMESEKIQAFFPMNMVREHQNWICIF